MSLIRGALAGVVAGLFLAGWLAGDAILVIVAAPVVAFHYAPVWATIIAATPVLTGLVGAVIGARLEE